MRLVVLVCAVTLLVCEPASCGGHETIARRNLNFVYDLAEECSTSLSKIIFVDDVSEGTNKCGNAFFCKVQEILGNLREKPFCKTSQRLVAGLKAYNVHRNVNCTEAAVGWTRGHSEITVFTLMKNLMNCIRQRNFKGTK